MSIEIEGRDYEFEDLAREYPDEAKQFLEKFLDYVNLSIDEIESGHISKKAIDRFLRSIS
jgi:hypothetical protein